MADPIPLRRPDGDPACADLLHRCRAAIEVLRDRVTDDLATLPIGPQHTIATTAWINLGDILQAIHVLAPARTRVREDVA